MVVLATAATVIASQAVISGAFSLTRQAMQLGLLPPLTVRQTSEHEGGQVYLPGVNAGLFVGVLVLMLAFGSSQRLATAYGVSVTGALVVDTVLLLLVARVLWHWPPWKLPLAAVAFGGVELTFLAANLSKVAHGGWLPLLVAAVVFTVMTTWRRGREIVTANRRAKEGSLRTFVEEVRERAIPRVPGTAVFPHPGKDTVPLALRANTDHNHVLHETVIIVSASAANVPHVPLRGLTSTTWATTTTASSTCRSASASPTTPTSPRRCSRRATTASSSPVSPTSATRRTSSRAGRSAGPGTGDARWRKTLFIGLAHNAADPAAYFGLPGPHRRHGQRRRRLGLTHHRALPLPACPGAQCAHARHVERLARRVPGDGARRAVHVELRAAGGPVARPPPTGSSGSWARRRSSSRCNCGSSTSSTAGTS